MSKVQIAFYDALKALLLFFNNEKILISKNKILAEDVAQFFVLFTDYQNAKDASDAKPDITTEAKAALKMGLAEVAVIILAYFKRYGSKNGLTQLTNLLPAAKVAINNLSDAKFNTYMKEIVEKMNTYSTVLAEDYKFSLAKQTDFSNKVSQYNDIKPQITVQISESTSNTSAVDKAYKAIKYFVDNDLSVAVSTEVDENPDFVDKFNDLCEGRAVPTKTTQIIITTVNDLDGSIHPFANVSIPERKIVGKTDENGKLVVKTGIHKHVTMTFEKMGIETQVVKMTDIKRGDVIEIEIRLKEVKIT